ncbi:helix-turn-helix transcriptional regulator [Yoonia sp. R2331]|uniref:helix-turn-helix transcriptional regulator n=1 Tax=Yoonia sp. R2331 TaxID=3237238 RepID=UPI0034E40B3F
MNGRARQDAIVRTLRRSGSATLKGLAQEVGASRSTILRDIAELRDEGFVIDTEQGRGGGVSMDTRSVQTAARLTVTEVFALVISVASMQAAGQLPFSGLADAGLAKIEKALPPDKLRDLRRLLDCLYVGPLAPQVDVSDVTGVDPALLSGFEDAFLNRNCLRFQYSDARGACSVREVEPQAMLILPPLWYLVAWDPDRQDFRHFRMDRITGPEQMAGSTFRKRHVTFSDGVHRVRYA